jgi:hypothetical protein
VSRSVESERPVASSDSVVAGRYRLERPLGQGGAAEVFAAYDELTGRRVALKRLLGEKGSAAHDTLAAHFRHEFLVLSQVAHANVIEAYDFGLEQGVPYYTMELVDGAALSARAPLSIDAVVSLLRGLSEPLSILHSRRWVHRDLSPRNVLLHGERGLKLIDFGATVSMDESHQPVGTPPFMAPEVLHQQQLDATTDVFGLGALAYFALTGRQAFPARSLAELPQLWQQLPRSPRALVPALPATLDELIMAMLSMERGGRPRSMAEVLHRLAGGTRASLPPSVATARAYLDIPRLTGRDAQVLALRRLLQTTNVAGRGAVCVLRGEPGSGRSRLLETAGLEARVSGACVARAGARLTGSEPLALVRELAVTLSLALAGNELALKAAPAWLRTAKPFDEDAAPQEIATAQQELVEWLNACCRRTTLVLLVDDFEVADKASQRSLAQLGMQARGQRLLLCISCGSDTGDLQTLRILLEHAVSLELVPLSETQVEDWARSVFGDVPNLARLARWTHRVSGGKPAACMELARYLVDNAVVTLAGGSWRLPDQFDELRLPTTMRDALHARLERLGPEARQFLQLLATEVEPPPVAVAAYVDSFLSSDASGNAGVLQLTAAGVLSAGAHGYSFGDAAARHWASEQLDSERTHALHRELAHWHESRASASDPTPRVYACYHAWQAGDFAAADRLLDPATLSRASTGGSSRLSRSALGIALFENVLAFRRRVGGSPAAIQAVLQILLAIGQSTRPELGVHGEACVKLLEHDIGFDLWETLSPELSEQERVVQGMKLADARWKNLPEAARGWPPIEALKRLGATIAILNGISSVSYQAGMLAPLQRIIRRVKFISPALALISDMLETSLLSIGRGGDVRDQQARLVQVSSQPIPQIDEPIREAIHALYGYFHAMQFAADGSDDALAFLPPIERLPLYAAHALQVRRVHALMTGRYREAQRYRRQRELLALTSESGDHQLAMSLLREMGAALICADVLELARCHSAIKRRAQRFPGWQPWAAISAAYLHMLAAEWESALGAVDDCLRDMQPLDHGAWPHLQVCRCEALLELGRTDEMAATLRRLQEHLAELELRLEAAFKFGCMEAFALAARGDAAASCALLEQTLDALRQSPGPKSLHYGKAHEMGCKIALLLKDRAMFTRHFEPMSVLYASHAGLQARTAYLLRTARALFESRAADAFDHETDDAVDWQTRIATMLGTQGGQEQAEYLLSLILEEAGANHGQLYRLGEDERPVLLAARPPAADPKLLTQVAQCCLERRDDTAVTQTVSGKTGGVSDSTGLRYELVWLMDPQDPERTRGLVVVAAQLENLSAITRKLRQAVSQHLQQLR